MTGGRDLGLDAARGIALVSMFVAHFAPSGGPADVLQLSEHLTASLFVLLIGCGAELGRASVGRWRSSQVRAAVLVLLGVLLTQPTSQIVVILVWLGVMTVVATWLAQLPSWALVATGVAALTLEPPLLEWGTGWRAANPFADPVTEAVVSVAFAHPNYRLVAFLLPACAGILAVRHLASVSRWLTAALSCLAVMAVLFVLDQVDSAPLVPYSGTRQQLVFDTAVAVLVLCLAHLLAPRLRTLATGLAAMGLMSLTIYSAQVIGDWAYTDRTGANDNSWMVLAVACAASLGFALAWRPIARRTGWRGPLEGPVDALARGRRPSSQDLAVRV